MYVAGCRLFEDCGSCFLYVGMNDVCVCVQMELYAEALGPDATPEDNTKIANYYEKKGKPGQVCVCV